MYLNTKYIRFFFQSYLNSCFKILPIPGCIAVLSSPTLIAPAGLIQIIHPFFCQFWAAPIKCFLKCVIIILISEVRKCYILVQLE